MTDSGRRCNGGPVARGYSLPPDADWQGRGQTRVERLSGRESHFVTPRGEYSTSPGRTADRRTFHSAAATAKNRTDCGACARADPDLRRVLPFRGIGKPLDRFAAK